LELLISAGNPITELTAKALSDLSSSEQNSRDDVNAAAAAAAAVMATQDTFEARQSTLRNDLLQQEVSVHHRWQSDLSEISLGGPQVPCLLLLLPNFETKSIHSCIRSSFIDNINFD